jgi:methylated-DNA-[protein]-cysteine S-methyltransferase
MTLFVDALDSPIGPIHLVSDGRSLCALELGAPEARLLPLLRARFGRDVALREAHDPLGLTRRARAWFEGDLAALDGIPVDGGGTPFQRRVWAALRRIAPGETTTYGALAATLGAPGAARAVGLACGRNPIAIVVPCHRVVGADGRLTGYAGGLDRKRWLLDHERRALTTSRAAGEAPGTSGTRASRPIAGGTPPRSRTGRSARSPW